jgi:hypothetical protein
LLGVGTQHAAELLTTLGQNCDRIHSEAAFRAPVRSSTRARLLRSDSTAPT